MMGELLVLSVIVSALSSLIAFSSENERWVKFAVGAALASSVALTLFNTVEGLYLPEIDASGGAQVGGEIAEEALSSAFAEGIEKDICEKFGVAAGDISVSASGFTYGSLRASRIEVRLSGRAIAADAPALRRYVSENYGECEVISEIEQGKDRIGTEAP